MSEQCVHLITSAGEDSVHQRVSLEGSQGHTHGDCPLLLLGCSWFPPLLPWNLASLRSPLSSVPLLMETSSSPTGGRNLSTHLIIATSRPLLVPRRDSSSPGSQRTQPWARTSPPFSTLQQLYLRVQVSAPPARFRAQPKPLTPITPSCMSLDRVIPLCFSPTVFLDHILWWSLDWLTSWRTDVSLIALGPWTWHAAWQAFVEFPDKWSGNVCCLSEQHSTTVGWVPSVDHEGHSAGHPSLIRKNKIYESISHIVMVSLTSWKLKCYACEWIRNIDPEDTKEIKVR